MRYLYAIVFFVLCFSARGYAQPYVIRGSVTDTLNNIKLPMASVVLIRSADSVIAAHARTDGYGNFAAQVKTKGSYFLRVTFPGLADYIDNITVSKAATDVGDLPMVSKAYLLEEFVFTQQAAITIKGDTNEYMADSFKVKAGSTVEDLLKKLPGLQVDKNGQIVAQGETVQRILVDGEEFFSDDPKVVTRGLQAGAVKKVQVYDKKSEQAEFTGIDDGQKTKTINLQLKEDMKKGYFGKLDAGGGSDGYFQNQAMINAFKAKRQFSAFGVASSTDKAGLGWQDNSKFGSSGSSTRITGGGAIVTSSSANDDFAGWDGSYTGEGLPKTWTAGTHYANKWKESKHHLSANYRFARQNVDINGNSLNQYSLPGDSIRVTDMDKTQFSTGDRHGLDVLYDWQIDSSTSMRVTANAGLKNSQTASTYITETTVDATDAPNASSINERTITSDATAEFINADLLLRKKFAKKGRTLSFDAKENYSNSENAGIFKSAIVDTAISTTPLSVDQRKVNNSNTLAFSGKLVYTEPLSKVAYLELGYGLTVNNSTAENKSYDLLANNEYSDTANALFSSDYKYNILANTGGLNFKFVYKKYNFSFGSDVSKTDYVQTDRFNGDTSIKYSYVNLFPKASFSYGVSRHRSININYQGSTNQPSITQIQPFNQNTDPINITVGNPDLKQEFVNNVSLRFRDFKMLQSRFLWATVSFSTTSNAISTEQKTTGTINTPRYINVDGNYSGFGYLGYGFKVGTSDFMVGAQLNGSIYHVNNIINDLDNTSNNMSVSFGPYVNYDKESKFEFRWNPSVAYNNNTSTNNVMEISYYILNNDLSGSVQLPAKFELGSSVDMMFRQKTVVFATNNNVIKWNAYIEKKFLKKSELALRFSVFDILNQNLGFSRTAQGNVVVQNSYNTIRRYGMLNLIWNFTHAPSGTPPPTGGGMMRHRR